MLANLFWGAGFVATLWSLESFTINQILFFRFFTVGIIGLALTFYSRPQKLKGLLKLTFLPALFLIMEILFQILGLKHTTATKAGFLTVTYIIIVPTIESLINKKPIGRSHWLWVALSLFGTFLMLKLVTLSFNWGDFLILISALGASLHIILVDKVGKNEESLFLANTLQSVWGAILIFPFFLFTGIQSHSFFPHLISLKAISGLLSITFGSTLLAFYFQMRAQRKLSPSLSSILFLLESPIAAIFGYFLMKEHLDLTQWFGCFLILLAAVGITLSSFYFKKRV